MRRQRLPPAHHRGDRAGSSPRDLDNHAYELAHHFYEAGPPPSPRSRGASTGPEPPGPSSELHRAKHYAASRRRSRWVDPEDRAARGESALPPRGLDPAQPGAEFGRSERGSGWKDLPLYERLGDTRRRRAHLPRGGRPDALVGTLTARAPSWRSAGCGSSARSRASAAAGSSPPPPPGSRRRAISPPPSR